MIGANAVETVSINEKNYTYDKSEALKPLTKKELNEALKAGEESITVSIRSYEDHIKYFL